MRENRVVLIRPRPVLTSENQVRFKEIFKRDTVFSMRHGLLTFFFPSRNVVGGQALKASEAASRVGGSARRVAELFRATGFSDEDAQALGPWSKSGAKLVRMQG